jgi:hypothetical protein
VSAGSVAPSIPYLPEDRSKCRTESAETTKALWAAEASTHNAFRFAAGSMSGDIYARDAFIAMG